MTRARTGRLVLISLMAAGAAGLLAQSSPPAQAPQTSAPARYDVIIRHGRVLDGTGNP